MFERKIVISEEGPRKPLQCKEIPFSLIHRGIAPEKLPIQKFEKSITHVITEPLQQRGTGDARIRIGAQAACLIYWPVIFLLIPVNRYAFFLAGFCEQIVLHVDVHISGRKFVQIRQTTHYFHVCPLSPFKLRSSNECICAKKKKKYINVEVDSTILQRGGS